MGNFKLGKYLMFLKKKKMPLSAIQQMEASIHPAIIAPFNKKNVWVIARRLTCVQIKSCGDFSLIETLSDVIKKEQNGGSITYNQIVEYSEIKHKIIEKSLLNPSYDEIVKMLCKYDNIKPLTDQLEEIKKLFNSLPKEKRGSKEEKELQERYAMIELECKFILPEDFLSHMFMFAVSADNSDISIVSDEMLYQAAVKSKIFHNAPADNLSGNFTPFNKDDINIRALNLYHERIQDEREQR